MTWTVDGQLKTKTIGGVQNVVTEVPWLCSITVGTVTAKCSGVQKIEYDADAPFTAFDSLTEATVIGWVKEALTADAVAHYENACTHHATYQDSSDDYVNTTSWVFADHKPEDTSQDVPW